MVSWNWHKILLPGESASWSDMMNSLQLHFLIEFTTYQSQFWNYSDSVIPTEMNFCSVKCLFPEKRYEKAINYAILLHK